MYVPPGGLTQAGGHTRPQQRAFPGPALAVYQGQPGRLETGDDEVPLALTPEKKGGVSFGEVREALVGPRSPGDVGVLCQERSASQVSKAFLSWTR